jgi:small subunit ribosomal protein S17
MDKTIAVEIERIVAHPVYGKFIRRSGTILAHDEANKSREGDAVIVSACRPISKRKVWKLEQILGSDK